MLLVCIEGLLDIWFISIFCGSSVRKTDLRVCKNNFGLCLASTVNIKFNSSKKKGLLSYVYMSFSPCFGVRNPPQTFVKIVLIHSVYYTVISNMFIAGAAGPTL